MRANRSPAGGERCRSRDGWSLVEGMTAMLLVTTAAIVCATLIGVTLRSAGEVTQLIERRFAARGEALHAATR